MSRFSGAPRAIASAAEAVAGTVSKVLSAGVLGGLFDAATNPGRVRFPGGFTIQWGTTGSAAGTASIADTFHTAFTTLYAVIAQAKAATGTSTGSAPIITTSSTTGFTVYNGVGATCTFWWIAVGIT